MVLPNLLNVIRKLTQPNNNIRTKILFRLATIKSQNFEQEKHYSTICYKSDNNDKFVPYFVTSNTIKQSQLNLITKRFKKSKGKRHSDDDEKDDEEEEEEDDNLEGENPLLMDDEVYNNDHFGEQATIDVNSLRLDAVAKVGFIVSRTKIEESFYKGDLYINGERAQKKSEDISLGDEIDLIKCIDSEDPTKVLVKRILIVGFPDKATQSGRFKLKIKRWNGLKIDAYDK